MLLSLYFHFGARSEENGSQSGEVPNIPPRESNPNRRQYNRRDSERPNRHHGLVRGRSNGGMEKHIPSNGGKCSSGLFVPGGRSTDHHAKSVLALLYRQAKVSTSSKHSFSSTREAILNAPLQKNMCALEKNSSGTGDCSDVNSPKKTYRDGGNVKSICGQASPILDADHCMHPRYPQQPSSI